MSKRTVINKIKPNELIEIVRDSNSLSELCRNIGYSSRINRKNLENAITNYCSEYNLTVSLDHIDKKEYRPAKTKFDKIVAFDKSSQACFCFSRYKSSAKRRCISFDLSEDEFSDLVFSNCFYCGQEPIERTVKKSRIGKITIAVNGIDRIDSKMGYKKSNVISCCACCNIMKGSLDFNVFLKQIQKINEFYFK